MTGHVFLGVSLDGFVARLDHRLDWLTKHAATGEDHGYDAFMAGVDGIIMGSGSLRTVLTFGEWPYRKPVIVMSGSLTPSDIPPALAERVRVTDLGPRELMQALRREGWSRAYVDGGRLVQSFISEGLIEDLALTIVPILIGTGIRPFGEIGRDIDLELTDTTAFPSGLVQVRYRVLVSGK